MKIEIWTIILSIFFVACAGSRTPKAANETTQPQLNPMVKKWLDDEPKNEQETLAVLIVTAEPVKEYDFLTHVTGTTYTAYVTRQQLKSLMKDKRVERISTDIKKLH